MVDRDMVMQYHWGCAVGHVYSHPTPSPSQPQSQTERRSQDISDGMDDSTTVEQQLCPDIPDVPEGEEEANKVSNDEQKGRGSDVEFDDGRSEDLKGDDLQSSQEDFLGEMEMFGEDGDVLLTSYD
jgi:hypothetical protein